MVTTVPFADIQVAVPGFGSVGRVLTSQAHQLNVTCNVLALWACPKVTAQPMTKNLSRP
jgi:hypothetical protein